MLKRFFKAGSLRTTFGWSLIGNICYAASQWVVIAAIAKSEDLLLLGIFTFALSLISPVNIFLNFRLRAVVATDIKEDYKIGTYLSARLFGLLLLIFYALLYVLVFQPDGNQIGILVLVVVAKCFDSYSDLLYGYLQRYERLDIVAKSKVFQSLVLSTGIVLVILLKLPTIYFIVCWTAGSIINAVWYATRHYRRLLKRNAVPRIEVMPDLKWFSVKKVLILAFPLGVAAAITSMGSYLPNYFITSFISLETLGRYAAIASLVFIGTTILTALSLAVTPRLAKLWTADNYPQFRQLTIKLCAFGVFIGLSAVVTSLLIGRPILEIVYTPDFGEYAPLLTLLLWAFTARTAFVFLGAALTAMRIFNVHYKTSLIGMTVLAISMFFLIRSHELTGVAWSLILANVVQGLVTLWFFRRAYRAGVQ